VEDSITTFLEIMNRASLSEFLYTNRILIAKNPKDEYTVLIPVDQSLWNVLVDNDEFKSHIQELDITDESNQYIIKNTSCCDDLDSDLWINLDCTELYAGNVLKINLDELEYGIEVNKGLIPLKLKKAEYIDIKYRIFKNNMTLALKKRFDYPIEDYGFSVIRLFQIV